MDYHSDRETILTAVKDSVSVLQLSELQLTDLEISKNVFDLAELFVQKVTFDSRYGQPKVFTTLLPLCNQISLNDAIPEVKNWQQGLKALLRYPINLLLAPNRPELKRVKISTSYYVFHVQRKLKVAEAFLGLMGYLRLQGSSDLILHKFSQQDLYSIVADIVILHEDLKVVVFLLDRVNKFSRTLTGVPTEFKHVMLGRKLGPSMKHLCLDFIMSGHAVSSDHFQIIEHRPLTPSRAGYNSPAPLTSTPNQPFLSDSSHHIYHRGFSGSTQLEDSMSSELTSSLELPPPIMTQIQLQNMMRGIGSSYPSNSSFDREEVVSPTRTKSASYPTDNATQLPKRENSFETPSPALMLRRHSSSSSSIASNTSWGQTSFTRNLYQPFKQSDSSPMFKIGEEDSHYNERTSPPLSRQGRVPLLQKGLSVDSSMSDSAFYSTQPPNQYPSNQYGTDQHDGQYNQPTSQYDSHYGNQYDNQLYNYQPTNQPLNSRDNLAFKQWKEPTIRGYVNVNIDEISRRSSTENVLPRRGSFDVLVDVEKSLKPPIATPRRNSSHSSHLYLKQQDIYSQQGGIPEEEDVRKGISLSETRNMWEGNPSTEWGQMKGISPSQSGNRYQGYELKKGISVSESGKTWGGSKQEGDMIRQRILMESSSGSLEASRTWGGGKQEGEKIRQRIHEESLRAGQGRGVLVSADSSYFLKRAPFTSTGASAYSGSVINDSSWVCQRCSEQNQRDDNNPACNKCGKVPNWVTSSSSQYNYGNVGALNTVPSSSHYITERGHPSIIQTDSLSSPIVKPSNTIPPFITHVPQKQWTCYYCMNENYNNTNICDVCNEIASN